MASQWGNNSLAPGQSAGWFFVRDNLPGFLPALQVMPLTPSFTDGLWYVSSGGYPYINQLGISTIWSQLTQDLKYQVFYMVVQNNSNNTLEYAFLESDSFGAQSPVAAPGAGLGSNSNYFLYSDCDSILGLSVTINVTQQIAGSDGFGFQVNAYSGAGDLDGAQQYVITMDPQGNLYAAVDNWQNGSTQLINDFVPFATFANAVLPAGYALNITLANDAVGYVTAATYTVTDDSGNTTASTTIDLLSLNLAGGGGPVTTADLAPIVAFQMDLVDWANGGSTTLSSGAGTITYTAQTDLTVLSAEPGCVDWDYVTVETANSIYGPLPPGPSGSFTQSFSTGAASAMIRRRAGVSHRLILPDLRRPVLKK
jgi:hypothetical protein